MSRVFARGVSEVPVGHTTVLPRPDDDSVAVTYSLQFDYSRMVPGDLVEVKADVVVLYDFRTIWEERVGPPEDDKIIYGTPPFTAPRFSITQIEGDDPVAIAWTILAWPTGVSG